MKLDPYMTLTTGDGRTFSIRTERSGIVFVGDDRMPVDDELAVQMLAFKAWKFGNEPTVGRA